MAAIKSLIMTGEKIGLYNHTTYNQLTEAPKTKYKYKNHQTVLLNIYKKELLYCSY